MPRSLVPPGQHPLRIAVVVEDLQLPLDEGAKKTGFNLIRAFTNEGAKVFIFTRCENPLLENTSPLPRNKLLFGCHFAQKLRGQSPDVIVYLPASSGTFWAFVRAAIIKLQSFGTPLALLNLQYRKLPSYARYFSIQRYIDIVFTLSQASADMFRSFGCRTTLLPAGVDRTTFRPAGKQEKRLLRLKYGFSDADRIVLHVGHCSRDRNVITLAALAGSGFKAILIASTSTVADTDLLAELKRAGVRVVTDFLVDIQHFYQIADCYLFPVFNPTSAIDVPLSVLEAMACNLPIVTTPFGGLSSTFPFGQGLYYWDSKGDMTALVTQAIERTDCRTVDLISRYSWDYAASTTLQTLQRLAHA